MKKVWVLVLFCAFSTIQFANAQEDSGEMFKWFPKGHYESIHHYGAKAMKGHKLYELFDEMANFPRKRYYYNIPLPKSFLDACDSYTKGKIAKVKISSSENTDLDVEKFERPSRGGLSTQVSIGGEVYNVVNQGDDLLVYSSQDLDALMQEAEKKGVLVKTGKKIRGIPVYKYRWTSDRDGEKSDCFYLNTGLGDLLVATSTKYLEEMYLAGTGEAENIMANQEYLLLADSAGKVGLSWEMTNFNFSSRAILAALSKKGGNQRRIKNLEKAIKESEAFQVGGYIFKDYLALGIVEVFESSSQAEEFFKRRDYSEPGQVLDGNLIIHETKYDEARINATREYIKNMKARQEEANKTESEKS